jgi:heme/copper-type cytochrome/quinol oxidase subunit 4
MDSDEDKHGQSPSRASIAAIIFVVLIVAGCVWLFEKLSAANDELNCVASGRRNCDQLNQ